MDTENGKTGRALLVAFCGAAGVGKTTIIQGLQEVFESDGLKIAIISEIARKVFQGFFSTRYKSLVELRQNEDDYFMFQRLIAQFQIEEEQKAVHSDVELVLSDRSVLDNMVYSLIWSRKKNCITKCSEPKYNFFDEYIKKIFNYVEEGHYDLLFYVPPFGKKLDDGFRTQDLENQDVQDKLIQAICASWAVPIKTTSIGERIAESYMFIWEKIKKRRGESYEMILREEKDLVIRCFNR